MSIFDKIKPYLRKRFARRFRNHLNSISPSFCLAKWKQVTIHLATGYTHSCHHPAPHRIPPEEIVVDVSALHNTKFKKEQRKLMLEGKRPKECGYCWNVEDSDSSGEVFSDRIVKSLSPWAKPYMKEVANSNFSDNAVPSYMEVSFSNACNFKCSYCSPEVSSQWMDEIKKYGPYPTTTKFNNLEWLKDQNKMPILEREYNPYVEAFWKWWPEIYPKLEVLRITGGEPLLTKNTFKVLEYVLENPRPELELNINSNLCVPDKIFDSFIAKIKQIQLTGSVKSFKLYTSCESIGARAEYIRYGLDYHQWLTNCRRILEEIPTAKLTIMSTYNALSVTSYKDFLKDVLNLRKQYANGNYQHPMSIDMPYLRWPSHQSVNILTKDYLHFIEEQIDFMKENLQTTNNAGFHDYEINSLNKVYSIFLNSLKVDNNVIDRRDFVLFIDNHDHRRNTNFLETFPEMSEFYNYCKTSC